jgi:hydrogenase small subunit
MTSFRNISRRDFLKFCAGTASLLGLSEAAVPRVAKALEGAAKKPPVIWLEGQDCAGCSISFINSSNPGTAEIVLGKLYWIPFRSGITRASWRLPVMYRKRP